MSQESNANAGKVDSVNTTGVTLSSVDARGLIEGTSIYVREKAAYYILEFSQANVIDHDLYETAKGVTGAQWIKLVGNSGGSGTINTSSPLSGDGSVGTPATIANGAITLSKLAAQADQTFLLNISGAPAFPIAGTAAQAANALPLVTTTVKGMADSKDKFWIEMSDDKYARDEAFFLQSKVSQLAHFKKLPIGFTGGAGVLGTDSAVDGANFSINANNVRFLTTTVVSSLLTKKWGLSLYTQFSAPSGTNQASVGLSNTAGSAFVMFGVNSGTSLTKFVMTVTGGTPSTVTSTINADTAYHAVEIFSDGTTIRVWLDGADSGCSIACASVTPDYNPVLGILNAVTGNICKVMYGVFGWV